MAPGAKTASLKAWQKHSSSRRHGQDAIKPWSLPQITFEHGCSIHESHGLFFLSDGAEKGFTIAQGASLENEETFYDYCR